MDLYSSISKIISINNDDAIEALYMDGDYEDNILAQTSKSNMCDAIITNNKKDFEGKDVVALTPEEYIRYRH